MDRILDATEPDRIEEPQIDNDNDYVAPSVNHSRRFGKSANRFPVKGAYWFIREKYWYEVDEAIAKDLQHLHTLPYTAGTTTDDP